jgi:hypothetical protein
MEYTPLFCIQDFLVLYGIYQVLQYTNTSEGYAWLLKLSQGATFFMGHFPAISADPSGVPMRRWINEIPNNGLIRYM